ncbi:MAG: RDD family protein [Chloroflexota bacterium]
MTYHQDAPLNIDTPENVAFAYDVAGIGSRFMSAAVDTIIIFIGQFLIVLVMVLVSSSLRDEISSFEALNPWVIAISGVVSFLMYWGYYVFYEMAWNGQTPGKRLVKLRVVRVDGTPITLSESLIRNIVRLVDFLPFNYAVGIIVMFTNNQSRRLGDLAAGTLVIRDIKQEISLESLDARQVDSKKQEMVRPYIEGLGDLPIEKLSDADIHLAKEFLLRNKQQSNLESLGIKILRTLVKKMDLSTTNVLNLDPASTLSLFVDFYEKKKE